MTAWVVGLVEPKPGAWVLDAGFGNGRYLAALAKHKAWAVGCDLSMGMLQALTTYPW
ncbi:MAG: class I SAM-dependent methyltransferase [Acidimicrobiales bacterium]